MNRTGSILLWLIGEAILFAGFLKLGVNLNQGHLLINFIVSSIILTVCTISLYGKKVQFVRKGVSKGMKWFFTLNYTFLSIAAMLYFDFVNPVDLLTQIIVQAILLAVLCMGMWGAFKPHRKSHTNTKYLQMEQNQLIMIRNVINVARARAEKRTDIPTNVLSGIIELQEEARLISPANEYVALRMEGRIMLEMNQIIECIKEKSIDLKKLQFCIKSCSKLFMKYRETYSMPQVHQFT
jgi:hypothetical protein